MENLDPELIRKLTESALIALLATLLFFGLRGRIAAFAAWANLPRLAFTPVRLLLRYTILVAAALVIMNRWGFEMNTLLTALGTILGLVAIGFVAMWSVLSNLLCTFVLVVFKPFNVGDEIEMPDKNAKGRVVDLSLIFTTLETTPGETVIIPNNTFFQTVFKRRTGKAGIELADQLRMEHPHKEPTTPS